MTDHGTRLDLTDDEFVLDGLPDNADIVVTAAGLRALAKRAAEPYRQRLAAMEPLLRAIVENATGGMDDISTDGLCGRLYGGDVSHLTLATDALCAASRRIEDMDLALGQIRTLAMTGVMGDEPLSQQDSRVQVAGISAPRNLYGRATPDDAIADVAAELYRLARLATVPREH
jgi:hypothetical protein